MRLSTNMIYQQNMNGVLNAQSDLQRIGMQLSSGKRVLTPSDDPLAATQLVSLNQAQSQNTQFSLARDYARQGISLEESVLQQVTATQQNIKTVLVDAGNGTKSDDDRASLAIQLQGLRDQLLNLANSTDGNGRYIFAGYNTDKPPYTETGGVVSYGGGANALEQKVDSARTMTVGHTGDSVFNSTTSNPKKEPDGTVQKDIFAALDKAIAALNTPIAGEPQATKDAVQADIDSASRCLENSLNNVSQVRAELGSNLKELDALDAVGSEKKIIYETRISDTGGVDWYQAISDYSLRQLSLQASYQAFIQMKGMSLFQQGR